MLPTMNRRAGVVRRSLSKSRPLSTTTSTTNTKRTSSTSSPRPAADTRIIARTLYRQLLQWCRRTDPHLPLSHFLPPMHLVAPELLDPYTMELLAAGPSPLDSRRITTVRRLLPAKTDLKGGSKPMMTVPVYHADDLQNSIRALYRINHREDDDTDHASEKDDNTTTTTTRTLQQKQGIQTAFGSLKNLNALSADLHALQEKRRPHTDRAGVVFAVGQVVQHQHERWRGVVLGWERPKPNASGTKKKKKKTSLTHKDYTDEQLHIRYRIMLDSGDAHSMGSSGLTKEAVQADLQAVTEEGLCRIRNSKVEKHFDRFDATRQCFVPNELVAYEYPTDAAAVAPMEPEAPTFDTAAGLELCEEIISGVQAFAARLERLILDESSAPSERGLDLLAAVQDRASALAAGDVLPSKLRFAQDVPPTTVAANHIFYLHYLSVELLDFTFRRRASKEHANKIKYALGDIVYHTKYGFRGVVIGWDHKPSVDVTRWDGLQDVENPMEIPFYHIVPDQGDCVQAFGGERPHRYVCEANLEHCAPNRRLIDVDLEPEWHRNAQDGSYAPPQGLMYKYGVDLKDDGITERCMTLLHDAINEWQSNAQKSNTDDHITAKLSLDKLVSMLQVVDTLEDALAIQDTIKEIRKAHRRPELRRRLEDGIAELLAGNGKNARAIFSSIVQDDPEYVEGWNRLATCDFMLGKMDNSLESTKRTLELDPSHYQAINGLGLIYFERDDYMAAAQAFRDSLKMDPWSPVSSKLSICLDLLGKIVEPDERA